MLLKHQKVVGHVPPGPTYSDTPEIVVWKCHSLLNMKDSKLESQFFSQIAINLQQMLENVGEVVRNHGISYF